ncbi:MAG TPA: tetratricopeptide repeat protein [Terriglobia bacterium]|nr:tetratricopeptide repeat protein [Terriglobia bacterium]
MQVETSSETTGFVRWIARRGFAETLVCAIALFVYIPTLGFEFVYDDKPQIIQNPAIHAWRYVPHYFTSHAWAELYPNVSGNYYRPLFLLWFRLNHAIFGLNPEGWHLTTVLCHVAATYMVFALVRRLAASPWVAFSAATLFALHPVHIESVAWVSGVTDPLVVIFLIGSFLAYLRFREENRWGWMGLALALFALGLLEKETIVVLGPLVFLYAWLYAHERSWISRLAIALKQCLAFLALTILYLALRAQVLRGLSHSVTPVTLRTMALTEPSIVWLYFRHLLFPVGLSGLYGLPYVDNPASAAFLVPTALLLALILALAWGIRRLEDPRLALFACAWMALPIFPVLWLRAYAEGDIAHDRYLYIPSIGFVLLVSLGLAGISKHWHASRKTLQIVGLAGLALAYALGTVTQQTCWATDLLLYERAYRIAPRDNLICNDLGTALMDAGHPEDAIALYSQVLARQPRFWLSNYNLGYTYYKIGKPKDAEVFLRRAVSINAADSDEFIYLGLSVWRQGRAEEAAQYVQRAIQIRPSAPGYHFALAMIRRDQNNIPAAESEFNQELRYHPESTAARKQLEALVSGAATGSK